MTYVIYMCTFMLIDQCLQLNIKSSSSVKKHLKQSFCYTCYSLTTV